MKPTFDHREITRRFRIERTGPKGNAAIRIYVEARRRNGQLYWRKVWTSGQAKRYGDFYPDVWEMLQIHGLFDDVLDLDANEVAPIQRLLTV